MFNPEIIFEAVTDARMDMVKREFATHTESGIDFLVKKMVRAHTVIEEVQKRNEARGYVYGYDDKGRFVILKTPDNPEK